MQFPTLFSYKINFFIKNWFLAQYNLVYLPWLPLIDDPLSISNISLPDQHLKEGPISISLSNIKIDSLNIKTHEGVNLITNPSRNALSLTLSNMDLRVTTDWSIDVNIDGIDIKDNGSGEFDLSDDSSLSIDLSMNVDSDNEKPIVIIDNLISKLDGSLNVSKNNIINDVVELMGLWDSKRLIKNQKID